MKYGILALLLISTIAHAEQKFLISGRLKGYTLQAGLPTAFHVTVPTKRTTFGAWAEYRYPSQFDAGGSPTQFSMEPMGFHTTITLEKRGDQIFYFGEIRLSEVRSGTRHGVDFPWLSSRSPFRGYVHPGKETSIPVLTPRGKKVELCFTLNEV